MKLVIAHLYPRLMNIYGDRGNLQVLIYRCQQRDILVTLKPIRPQDPLKSGSFDLLFAGGGQDRQQTIIASDLLKRKPVLRQALQANIPMLTICGSYQLFGRFFQPFKGPKLKGIGLFPAFTQASHQRKIGNIVIHLNPHLANQVSPAPPTLVGFENHSGNTFLDSSVQPLGKVKLGFGNNGQDKTEGAVFRHLFGCYLHGSLLPKNPHLADLLIKLALENKYAHVKLKPLNDKLEWQAHQSAVSRANKLAHPLLKYIG